MFFFSTSWKLLVSRSLEKKSKSFWGFQTHSFSYGMCLWSCRTFRIQELTLFHHPIPCPFLLSVESRLLAGMICGAQSLLLSWEVSPWTNSHQEEDSFFKLPILESLLSYIVVSWAWWHQIYGFIKLWWFQTTLFRKQALGKEMKGSVFIFPAVGLILQKLDHMDLY